MLWLWDVLEERNLIFLYLRLVWVSISRICGTGSSGQSAKLGKSSELILMKNSKNVRYGSGMCRKKETFFFFFFFFFFIIIFFFLWLGLVWASISRICGTGSSCQSANLGKSCGLILI